MTWPCRLKTIFVDDEPDFELLIRQRYRRQLRSGELVLEFARNGREALDKLSADDEIAIVMTDINMPEMGGLALLAELTALRRDIPTVIVSAYGDMGNIRTAMNRGAFDFLTKPINFDDLEVTWKKTAAHCEQLRERRRLQQERRQLEQRAHFIRETFGRYLSDAVVERLLEEPDGLRLGGERRDVSVLMADLRGFSVMAERLPPEQCVALLNDYFEVMIDIVLSHGGTIDELLGDAILVVFGAPLSQPDHALRACACAVAMQRAMTAINDDHTRRGLPAMEMGIGIHSGEVVVGNIGSRRRAKYGVVGSPVNLAARIEARTVGGQVLISDSSYRRCAEKLEVESLPAFLAKGFSEAVEVHELRAVSGQDPVPLAPAEPSLVALDEPLAVRFAVLVGGGGDGFYDGSLLSLSRRAAVLRSDSGSNHPIDPSVTLRLQLLNADGGADCDDLYAKVFDQQDDGCLHLLFTSVMPQAGARIQATLAALGAG